MTHAFIFSTITKLSLMLAHKTPMYSMSIAFHLLDSRSANPNPQMLRFGGIISNTACIGPDTDGLSLITWASEYV